MNSAKIFWCSKCEVPLIQPKCGICSQNGLTMGYQLKPVFQKEFELYKAFISPEFNFDDSRFPPIFYRAKDKLYSNISLHKKRIPHFFIKIIKGKKLGQYKIEIKLPHMTNDTDFYLRRSRHNFSSYFIDDADYLDKLINANLKTLNKKEREAIKFIEKCSNKYSNMHAVCSFSGGKDSAVTAFLVKKAIGNIPLIFSDTRIEYPETIKYVKKYGAFFGDLIYLQSRNNFLEMCQKLGPPSRMMRWCCSTQKAGPINEYYGNFKKGVLSFDGIRRDESNLRAEYPRQKDNTKLIKQYSAYPIINWTDLEIWLYILWRKLPINVLYQYGFARIGCWGCPNNGKFDSFLFYHTHPELAEEWYTFLGKYWEKSASNYDLDWITDGNWKKRRVKYENEEIGLNFQIDESFEEKDTTNFAYSMTQPCLNSAEYIISFQTEPNRNLSEFLGVFGDFQEKKIGKLKFWEISGPQVNIKYFNKKRQLKFKILTDKNLIKLQHNLIKQINKSFNCIACGACVGTCPKGAIYLDNGFKINKDKCKHCLICCGPKYLKMSCVALHYMAKRKLVHRSNIQIVTEV